MTEEVKLPTPEELLAPEQAPEIVEAPETSPEEERAKASGWVPKEQWKGDPNGWRPAKEFNERGELFAHIKDLRKQTDETRRALQFLTGQQQKQYDKGFQDAISHLRNQRNAALEQGEHVLAAEIADRLNETKEQHERFREAIRPTADPVEPTEIFRSWHVANPWYLAPGEDNKALTVYANAIGLEFRNANPDKTEADMLRHVEAHVKKQFKDRFQSKGPPSPDGEGRQATGRATQGSTKYAEVKASMSDDDRSIMKTILRDTGMTETEYLKRYSE